MSDSDRVHIESYQREPTHGNWDIMRFLLTEFRPIIGQCDRRGSMDGTLLFSTFNKPTDICKSRAGSGKGLVSLTAPMNGELIHVNVCDNRMPYVLQAMFWYWIRVTPSCGTPGLVSYSQNWICRGWLYSSQCHVKEAAYTYQQIQTGQQSCTRYIVVLHKTGLDCVLRKTSLTNYLWIEGECQKFYMEAGKGV